MALEETRHTGRVKASVQGIVQGVGFRPFIYHLALERGLKGYVANTSFGVDIEAEGNPGVIEKFLSEIRLKKPPLAEITDIEALFLPQKPYDDFTIRKSEGKRERSTLISPDVSICKDCLRELLDPENRRYRYPFINCTNCGPRYTIIKDIPYDRIKTTMQAFKLCELCDQEYNNPLDRRFHAQPNACWQCGPRVSLYDNMRNLISCDDPIKRACQLLKNGQILAIKGLGGFHLAADATSDQAVATLRTRKQREEKPFALMSVDVKTIQKYARVNEDEVKLLNLAYRPIVLLNKRQDHGISYEVAPRNQNFGVMLPYAPLHYLILQEDFLALVMTSGNMSEEPIVIDNDDAFRRLAPIADYLLVHNRDIYLRSDDSIARIIDGRPRQIRRSRGYVPVPIFLEWDTEPVLACGPELKNTICLTKGRHAFLSQHIGDLENLETLDFLELTVGHLKRILEIEPRIIAYDLHPDYLSTKYALAHKDVELIGIQHHHAHIASCMAENGVGDTVIGLALDGTGFGLDGQIWGGEVLICTLDTCDRIGHFDYVPMPGGAAAIKEPWRMAASYLYHTYDEKFTDFGIEFVKSLDKRGLKVILQMIAKGVNAPLTSSIGRLFDAVSALVGLRNYVKHEGQAAVELEMCMEKGVELSYPYDVKEDGSHFILLHKPIIDGVVEDLLRGSPPGYISAKFHNTIVCILTDAALRVRSERGINKVALSGGAFQNAFLLQALTKGLEDLGFEVYTQSKVPSNDGGISLGQAVVASAIYKKQSVESKTSSPSEDQCI